MSDDRIQMHGKATTKSYDEIEATAQSTRFIDMTPPISTIIQVAIASGRGELLRTINPFEASPEDVGFMIEALAQLIEERADS